jgi:DNA-binding NtrC family response regulator/PAS domain-containing protein
MNTQLEIEPTSLRTTGIGVVGDVPWGTHFFLFYETKEDLLETLTPYFKAGLESGEQCIWVISEPLTEMDVLDALQKAIPGVERHLNNRSMEIVQGREWYLSGEELDLDRVARGWSEKLDFALSHGRSGLRLSAGTAWLAKKDWKEFCDYEHEVNESITNLPMLALCTYPLAGSGAAEILDVTRTHQFAIARRKKDWEVVETSELKQAKSEIKKLNDELEQRVAERTLQLTAANSDLKDEIARRQRVEEDLRRSEAFLAVGQRISHTGSWGWDTTTGEVHWSDEHFRIFGYDPGSVTPSYELFMERVHEEDRDGFGEMLQNAIRDGRDFGREYRIVLPDGTVKYLRSLGQVFTNSGHNFEFRGTVMDVTEQHQARASLQAAFEQIQELKDQLSRENQALREEVDRTSMFEEIVGGSPELQRVTARIARVAPTDSTVLITGETGTGKELIARAIHKRSLRGDRAFVSVNCAALSQSLIMSELFGHEKGAFTGAHQRRLGRFELADGGTIFLDEVGDLPAETQVALLRVLQEHQIERVGGNLPIPVNVRVIAATNRDLTVNGSAGPLRLDLFYRLNVFPITVPALRERRQDIPVLVNYFVNRYGGKVGRKFNRIERRTLDLFGAYDWPGNIRELQNVIERSVVLCPGEVFCVDESWLSRESRVPCEPSLPLSDKLTATEKEMIEAALKECQGQVAGASGAAAKLGIPPSTLDSRIKSLGISKKRFRFEPAPTQ